MKIPKDSPTKVGDRVVRRGEPGREGTVVRINAERLTWMFVLWDDVGGPGICHQNELRLIPDTSDIPEAGEEFFKNAKLKLPP